MLTQGKMSLKFITKLDIILVVTIGQVLWVKGTVSNVAIEGPSNVDEGINALFTCSGQCVNVSCSFSWGSVSGLTEGGSSATLTIKNIKRKPGGGKYNLTCTVRGIDGTSLSKAHSIDVYYGPDSVTLTPPSGQLTILEGVTYLESYATCAAEHCYPSCIIQWRKGTEVVSTNTRLYGSSSNAKRDHAGGYECNVTNTGQTTPTSKVATLTLIVEYPPDVTATWDSRTRTLTCQANGVPADYTFREWVHSLNDVTIRKFNGTHEGNTLTYQFPLSISYQDRGLYKCSVSNGKPNTGHYEEKKVNLSHAEHPLLVSAEDSFNVSKGAPLQLDISIYAIPEVAGSDITLLKNASEKITTSNVDIKIQKLPVNVPFHGKSVQVQGQKVVLDIHSVLEEYFGELRVSIKNSEGPINKDIDLMLHPEGAPDPPEGIKVTDVSHDQMTLTFQSGFFNGAAQTFVVEYRAADWSHWENGSTVFAGEEKNASLSATITDLSPETFYMFRSYGYNIYNQSEYTEVVNVTTAEAPLQLAAIIGGTVGGMVFVAIVIVVVIVFCRYSNKIKRDKLDKEDKYKSTIAPPDDEVEAEENRSFDGRDNIVYDITAEGYENTRVKNGVAITGNQNMESFGNTGSEEPIYMNNQNSSIAELRKISGQEPRNTSENLMEMEGYLDLSGDNKEHVEDAYATKDITQLVDTAGGEDEYLDMDVLKAPATAKYSFESMGRRPSKPQYSNVAQQIGLINQGHNDNDEPDETYLDMDVRAGPNFSASRGVFNAKHKHSGDIHMSMASKGSPQVRYRSNEKGLNNAGQYLNLHEHGMFDNNPPVGMDQESYVSMIPKSTERDSVPAYLAPPPPPESVPEDDYMNINMGAHK